MTSPGQPTPTGFLPAEPPKPPKSRAGGVALAAAGVLLLAGVIVMPVQHAPAVSDDPGLSWWGVAGLSHTYWVPDVIRFCAYALVGVGTLSAVVGIVTAALGAKALNVISAAVGAVTALTTSVSLVIYALWLQDMLYGSEMFAMYVGFGYYSVDLACMAVVVATILGLVGGLKKTKPATPPTEPTPHQGPPPPQHPGMPPGAMPPPPPRQGPPPSGHCPQP